MTTTAETTSTEMEIENGNEVTEVVYNTAKPIDVEPDDTTKDRPSLSISEAVELANTGFNAPKWLSWVEIPFRVVNPKTGQWLPEATGWAMDSCGKGALNIVGSYVGGAILRMATKEAGGPDESITSLHLKPSSLLTATSAFVGIVTAILMPIFGAIIDHTSHRRLVAVVSGVFAVGIVGMQTGISVEKNNWMYILIIDGIQSFALLVHHTASLAYLPDLSTDDEVTSHYTSRFNLRQYCSQILYIGLVLSCTRARGNEHNKTLPSSVQTAKDATLIAFIMGAIYFGYAWTFLFRHRPPLTKVPEGSTLLSAGFVQVSRTSKRVWRDYKCLKWFMISLLFSPEAGAGVILSVAVTYFTIVMKFTVQEIAFATLIIMASTIPGSLFAKFANRVFNPLNSYRAGMLSLGISMGLGAIAFTGPEQKNAAYGFASLWGFTFGWAYPSQRVLFCHLIPKGQETEFMGLFAFAGMILGWLPTLIITVLNENGVDLKYSLVVVLTFFAFSMLLTIPMGSYEEAKELVERDSAKKLCEVLEAARKLKLDSIGKDEDTEEPVVAKDDDEEKQVVKEDQPVVGEDEGVEA